MNPSSIKFIVAGFILIFALYHLASSAAPRSNSFHSARYEKPISPLRSRSDIPALLEAEGFTVGAELGVQRGIYAEEVLKHWPGVKRYYLIDLWAPQENYEDMANVDTEKQEALFKETQARLSPWKAQTVFLRNFTSVAVAAIQDGELDYVYVDARHDYCGCMEDMELYWPKLKEDGLMAGHDYVTAAEVTGQDWSVCMDGSKNPGAVRGAVDDFAAKLDLHVAVTYHEPFGPSTFLIRKPTRK